jgi:formate hydrogenlyase subunit 3/multisubunit Na+/H+ antiporter MnhD subunit
MLPCTLYRFLKPVGTLGVLGFPPFGVFTSEFLIITTMMYEQP